MQFINLQFSKLLDFALYSLNDYKGTPILNVVMVNFISFKMLLHSTCTCNVRSIIYEMITHILKTQGIFSCHRSKESNFMNA